MLFSAKITVEQEVIVAAIMIAFFYIYTQGRRNSGRAGGAVKELRAMEACKKQKKLLLVLVFAQQPR